MSDNKYKHPEGRATLFVNKYKEKETQPDMKGTMTDLDGNEFEIAGWKGKTQNGEDKISIQISKPYVKNDSTDDKEESDGLPF
jgi:uncharacterized protein (DUF736 family)